ncbi:MAG: sialate O-acetylesterase [Bacteroidota bacterium]
MIPRSLLTLVVALVLVSCSSAPPASDVQLPALFSDHMVLQRDMPIPVWGTASPGGLVTVSLDGNTRTAVASSDGAWQVDLPTMDVSGPHTLTVMGTDTTTFSDVLIGDVWVGSGQSNMYWEVRQSADADAEIAAASYPNLRIFDVGLDASMVEQDDVTSDGWMAVTPETIARFSAVAYYFGREVHQEMDVPIGLIRTAWGGTRAEAWTSRTTLRTLDDYRPIVEEMDTIGYADYMEAKSEGYGPAMAAWNAQVRDLDAGYTDASAWNAPDLNDSAWDTMTLPIEWELAGLDGFDGIVWFRRTIQVPANWADSELTLQLSTIDDWDSTYVNGTLVGHMENYAAERHYTLPAGVMQPGANQITVRVVDTGGGGGIDARSGTMQLVGPDGTAVPLDGDWHYKVAATLGDLPARPQQPARQHVPSVLYNAMIAPLIPFGIRGVIWYQGESNTGRAYQYRELFPAMITDWRTQWDQGDFSFYFVQLANFMAPQTDPDNASDWAELREAQTMTLDAVPNTAQAVIIDIGEADDIHPRNKQDVGKRLALAALALEYDRNVVYSGPSYREMTVEGNEVMLDFDHIGSGLEARGDALSGFAIAGADSVFVWADARIDGDRVVVSSPDVSAPIAVRYGWANNPAVNLYNADGLPASPFRTDDWPGVTFGIR